MTTKYINLIYHDKIRTITFQVLCKNLFYISVAIFWNISLIFSPVLEDVLNGLALFY